MYFCVRWKHFLILRQKFTLMPGFRYLNFSAYYLNESRGEEKAQ